MASGAAGGGVSEAEIEDLKDDALYFSRIKDIQQGLIPITDKLVRVLPLPFSQELQCFNSAIRSQVFCEGISFWNFE